MRILFVAFSFICFSSSVFAAECIFKPAGGDCTDDQFKLSIMIGDYRALDQALKRNPNLIYSCHEDSRGEWVTPVLLAICDGERTNLRETLRVLLSHGRRAQLACETPYARYTTEHCLRRIESERLKAEVAALIKAAKVGALTR